MKGSIATHVLYVPPFPIPVTAALAAIGPPPPSLPPARRGYATVAVADLTFVRQALCMQSIQGLAKLLFTG